MANELLTRHIGKAVETRPAKPRLFAMFYKQRDIHDQSIVEFDSKKYKNGIAPFVRPELKGKPIEIDGFQNNIVKLPTMKPLRPITAKDLAKRPFGVTIYTAQDKNAQARELVSKLTDDNMDRIDTRMEAMRAEQIFNNTTTIQGEGYDYVVTFGRSASNTVDLGNSYYWDQTTDYIDQNIREFKALAANAGKTLTHMVGRYASLAPLLDFVKTQTDFRRVENGSLKFQEMLLVNGANYEGTYLGIELWTYDGVYTDEDGTTAYMVPVKKIALMSAVNDNEESYGYERDPKLELDIVKDYTISPENIISILRESGDGVELETRLTAMPLFKDPDSTVSVKVLA